MTSKRRSFVFSIIIINANIFRNFLVLELLFLLARAMLNNFSVFEELVFFDLWIPVSGFRFPVSGFRFPVSGFRFPVSGFRFPVSGFRFPGFRVAQ